MASVHYQYEYSPTTCCHELYTLDRVTTILLDAESCLHDLLCLPLSINTIQATASTPIAFVSNLPLRPTTLGPSVFPSQTKYSGHFPTSHFVPRPRPTYNSRGRGIQPYPPPQPPTVNPSINTCTHYNPSQSYETTSHNHTPSDGYCPFVQPPSDSISLNIAISSPTPLSPTNTQVSNTTTATVSSPRT
ncbi:hypothetical protein J1N35_044864 [Gossypium stocksii]|uniref:Uncharacterized protein n=1 Tax=Gossypium stocksii TaxID=47602 RepID=A0A9D3ZGE3_9ROSI|nr:hypothetical protein J1N35_044864 [Gossypium stocksii]